MNLQSESTLYRNHSEEGRRSIMSNKTYFKAYTGKNLSQDVFNLMKKSERKLLYNC